jgi:uncharacterized iron-regulated membrane protein
MTVKKLIGQLHLWLGLASGLVVMVVAATGSLLVFEKELDEWAHQDFYFVADPAIDAHIPLDSLVHNVAAYDKDFKITRIVAEPAATDRSVLFFAKKKKQTWQIAVNPYTAQVIKAINYDKRFFTVVLQLHRSLLMNDTGKVITGASCLIFVILVISGIVLWWPKRWHMLKQRTRISWSAAWKRLNWDLHAVFGFYVHLVLFAISFTGLSWAYPWFNKTLYLLLDGKPMKKMEAPANTVQQPIAAGYYEAVYRQANAQLPYKGVLTMSMPEKENLALTVTKLNHDAPVYNITDFLYFEKGTGKLLKEQLYAKGSAAYRARRMLYPIHTGKLYGWPTKIIALIAALVAFSLPVTGFCIWWGRKKKKTKAPLKVVSMKKTAAIV